MKVGRIVKIAAICCSMSALLLSTLSVVAIAQQDKVGWYAELYLENPDYIVVRIDLRGLPTNRYIEDVSFEVTFHDAQSWVAEQNFDFTDSGLRRLRGGVVHERYFEHSYGFAQSAKGGDLFYTISTQGLMLGPPPSGRPTGGRSGAVPKERKRSGDRIQTSDIQLSGALPRPRSSRRTGIREDRPE